MLPHATDARRRLFEGALLALATEAPANVCWRFTAPADGTPIPDWICLLAFSRSSSSNGTTRTESREVPTVPSERVMATDARCRCTERATEIHHVEYRWPGGSDDDSNLTSICAFHHRMGEHGGLLAVAGTAPLDLRWQIGDKVFRNESLCASTR
jgi:hypothetical protein